MSGSRRTPKEPRNVTSDSSTGLAEKTRPLNDGEFSAAVAAVTSAFGDPTRRHVYLFARENPEGVTATDVAKRFELHPNVARHHLDKLTAGGYLEVFLAREASAGAGRPSKHYRPSPVVPVLDPTPRGNDLLITLLGRALELIPPDAAESMGEQVGEQYGRQLAASMTVGDGQRSFRSALHAVADALTAHGFSAHAEARGGSLALIKDECPFFDAARQHPVICAVDRGMVRGMLGVLCRDALLSTESSRAMGDAACVTTVA